MLEVKFIERIVNYNSSFLYFKEIFCFVFILLTTLKFELLKERISPYTNMGFRFSEFCYYVYPLTLILSLYTRHRIDLYRRLCYE